MKRVSLYSRVAADNLQGYLSCKEPELERKAHITFGYKNY